jgi:LysM repeat protein
MYRILLAVCQIEVKEAYSLKIHMVRKGETLMSLAEKFNVHPDALLSLNSQINNPEQLVPGMKVKIPIPPSPLELPPAEFLDEYVVKQGDTLWKLSKAWNVPLKALITVNPQLRNPNVLLDGEIVYIPKLAAEINRVEIQVQPPKHSFLQPEIQFEPKEAVILESLHRSTQEIEHVQEDYMTKHDIAKTGVGEPNHDRIDLSLPHHVEELSHISSVASETNIDPPQWGDLYTGYMTSAAKPYDKYVIDPRMNIPEYPEAEGVSPDQYQREKPRHGDEAKLSDRQPGKASSKASVNPKGRTKAGKSKTRNAVVGLSVQTNHSSTKRSSKPTQKKNKPWTSL